MVSIAREILLHDKLRFLITIGGLISAMVLILFDVAMGFGTVSEGVNLIDRVQADVWVLEEGLHHIFYPSFLPDSVRRHTRRLNGVRQACALNRLGGSLKVTEKLQQEVIIVGIDPDCPLGLPWNVVEGDIGRLVRDDTVILDDLILRRDPLQVGDTVEINGHEVHVVAITHDTKWFLTPYVFTNLRTSIKLAGKPGYSTFVVLWLERDADREEIIHQLMNQCDDIVAWEAAELRGSTVRAVVFESGMGAAIFTMVLMGIVVGVLVITLTVYTTTMERLQEFAILKAIGATNWKIIRIILEQTIIETLVGFGGGLACTLGLTYILWEALRLKAVFPIQVIIGIFVFMLMSSILGALIGVRKAATVDPMIVFRG